MTDINLTIAIPTYNRADLLIESVNSVVTQIECGVEVLIKDNFSSDHTQEVVQMYISKYPFVRYSRNATNIGPDANFLACLQEAKGDFVQLLSDDDILLPGFINKILEVIRNNANVSIIKTNCRSFTRIFDVNTLSKPVYDIQENIYFKDKSDFLNYVGFASIFMSPTIFKRSVFEQVIAPSKYIGSYLLQTHLIFECLAKSEESIIISDACVAARVGMPVGFGMVRVLVIEWKNVLYGTCLTCQYNKKVIFDVYNKNIRNSFPAIIRDAHLNESSYGSVFKVIFKSTFMFPRAWIFLYPYALLPRWMLRSLSFVKRIFN